MAYRGMRRGRHRGHRVFVLVQPQDQANPAFSYTYEDREKFAKLYNVEAGETKEARATGFTLKKKAILVLFVAAFPIMVWGVVSQGWWFPQMAASFLAIAIIIMFLSGIAEKKVVDAFIHGASSLVACRSSSGSRAAST